jgi:hypothetical protein
MKRIAAISTGPSTHLDHLGVLSALLEIPLIVTDEKHFHLSKRYYPEVEVQYLTPAELSLDYLATHFEAILGCGKYWGMEFLPLFELLYRKKMRFILCPHGNSEKGSTLDCHPNQDIQLIYGKQMEDLLKKNGAHAKIRNTIRVGNFRYAYYHEHQRFYDQIVEKEIFAQLDPSKKTILYAPTWSNEENPTDFYLTCERLLEQLDSEYNLIIKPHPFLEEEKPAHLEYLQAKFEKNPQVHFLLNFPPIYPLLSKTDIYVGDYSSIGYDFLAFNRPLYFVNESTQLPKKTPLLFQCGTQAPTDRLKELMKKSETREKATQRRKIYDYAFGSERTVKDIQRDIKKTLFGE